MNFYLEPTYWVLLASSLTACVSISFMRTIGRVRAAAVVTVWASSTGTIYILYGPFPALFAAGCSLVAGAALMIASMAWSGVKSMPNQRYEDR